MGGIRLPGPQPANPSNPAASGAINKPGAALRGSPGRRGLLAGAAPWPRIYCGSCHATLGTPVAALGGTTGRGATQGAARWCLGKQLSPFGRARNGWGWQEVRKGPQAGRAPLVPWGWGVLANPRGGVKVGSSNPAPARPGCWCSCAFHPSVPSPPQAAASMPWGCGMTLDSSLPCTPPSCQE